MWRHLAIGAALALGVSIGLATAMPTDDGPILPGIDAPLPPEPPQRSAAPRSVTRASQPAARQAAPDSGLPRRDTPSARPDPFERAPAPRPTPQRRTAAEDRSAPPRGPLAPGQSAAERYQQQLQRVPANRPRDPGSMGRDPRAQQRDPRAASPGRADVQRSSTAPPQSSAPAAPLWSQPSPPKAQGAPRSRSIGPQPSGPAQRAPARTGQPAVTRRPAR